MAAFALRLLMALTATATVVAVGSAALLCERAPAAVSLVLEPLSLVLLPGLVYGIVRANEHALKTQEMFYASLAFYLCFFFLLFECLAWERRRAARGR